MSKMKRFYEKDMQTKCISGMTALNRYFKRHPEHEDEWRETLEWMLKENVQHIDDTVCGDGSYNEYWWYSIDVEQPDEGYWYISIVLREVA